VFTKKKHVVFFSCDDVRSSARGVQTHHRNMFTKFPRQKLFYNKNIDEKSKSNSAFGKIQPQKKSSFGVFVGEGS
jgi:hypothetical protein